MYSIVCLKWGNKYSSEYVNKLYNDVSKHTSVEHEFICFTEDSRGIKAPTKELPDLDLKIWWNKLWLFNHKLPTKYNHIFYIDLDTVILKNIDDILLNLDENNFYIIQDFYRSKGWQSCIMSWQKGKDDLWEKFNSIKDRPGHGDQGFIEHYKTKDNVVLFQNQFPEDFISYKVHLKEKTKRYPQKGSIQTAKFLCFHGSPMPHQVPEFWNNR